MESGRINYIGVTDWRDVHKRFGIRDRDRANHMYVLGKSGTGKSTLMLNMIINDVRAGNGIAAIDAHSDLAETLLHYIPKERIKDVIYFNAADTEYPIGFNPLAQVHPAFHHLVASGIIGTLKRVWTDSWGPRLEHHLRFALLTILEYGRGTLLDIQPLLTDERFREKVLLGIKNPYLRSFWRNEHGKGGAGFRAEAVSPILNKLGIFIGSAPLRNTFGQVRKSFTMQEVLDEGKVLIVNLSKGVVGEDVCSLLGSILVSAIQNAALFRAIRPEAERKPFYLYVDEMQTFVSLSFADALSESRKYGLSLFLCHQYIQQLHEDIRQAIFGNVGTMICFRVGAVDARYMSREFHPLFAEADFIHLEQFSMYIKLAIDGTVSVPFSARSLPLTPVDISFKKEIVDYSRSKYSLKKEEVEQGLLASYAGAERKANAPTLFEGNDNSCAGR